ncbi:MAG TPA: energy transducer TonB [Mucilaginibacter sp.]|jgi:TonB family protein|nr:energy transducer TonB [Mucilaginibacter sp.]
MRPIVITIALVLLLVAGKAQSNDTIIYKHYRLKTDTAPTVANYPSLVFDAIPQFPGGEKKLNEFLKKTTRYPQSAKKKRLSGKVFVSFVIEKDGHISNAKVIHGISVELNNEALRVVNCLPKWKPAIYKNEPVRVQYLIPVKFELTDNI